MVATGLAAVAALPTAASAKSHTVKVMTRNLYLGADLTQGVQATSLQQLVDVAGGILSQVDQNKFPTRAKGLAAEIHKTRPDLVGLQEVSEYRTEPCTQSPLPPKATTVRYDYLKSLLSELNKGKKNKRLYRAVKVEPEFDFEVYVNSDGNQNTSAPGCPLGSELNVRLTMRDAILARKGVKTSHAKAGHFATLLQVRPGGVPTNVTRGWTRVDAKVGKSKTFRFVNTHLEAFDNQATNHTSKNTDVGNGQIRQAQAQELVGAGGPAAKGKLPVILVGDLNSDVATVQKPGDQLAYQAVLGAGFAERSTSTPLGCCLNANVLTTNGGGKPSDFNHRVDHVLTNSPSKIKLVHSVVTGLTPVNGFWDSDHAGLFSQLKAP
jgi:endonuclease/exonuclease/phosphatase family metal-dependent hydrolase